MDKTYKTGLKMGLFQLYKIILHHKIIIKTRTTKNQEYSAHHFGDKYVKIIS